jgi:CubicO group peptidase (beta-lactamase class C family)
MIIRHIISLVVLACLSGAAIAGNDRTPAPTNLVELKQSVSAIIERYEVPAIGIAMIDKDGPVWIGALGQANLEQDIGADERTLFRIASTSKMFVSLSILRLVEQGKLTLRDKLVNLAPEITYTNQWQETHPIRLVHLLEHTTGWDEQHYPEMAQNDPAPSTLTKDLDFHPHSRQSRWPPGTRFSYTNSGPAVAARIVEKISGQRFEDYVQQHFFDPIGMTTASYFLSADVRAKGATLYDKKQALDYRHLFMRPSGAINASALDMATFLRFYLDRGMVNGTRVLSEESLNRMETAKSSSAAQAGQHRPPRSPSQRPRWGGGSAKEFQAQRDRHPAGRGGGAQPRSEAHGVRLVGRRLRQLHRAPIGGGRRDRPDQPVWCRQVDVRTAAARVCLVLRYLLDLFPLFQCLRSTPGSEIALLRRGQHLRREIHLGRRRDGLRRRRAEPGFHLCEGPGKGDRRRRQQCGTTGRRLQPLHRSLQHAARPGRYPRGGLSRGS